MEQVQENFEALTLLRSKASSHKPCEREENPLDALSAQDKLPQSMQGLSEGAVAAPGWQMVAALTTARKLPATVSFIRRPISEANKEMHL